MIVSNFLSRIDNDNRNIEIWCSNEYELHMKFAKNFAENITLFFQNYSNSRLNIIWKVIHVAIPNFHDNGIIYFGLVFYKETDIIYDKKLYPITRKIEVAQLVGRKVIQEWFNILLNNPLVANYWMKKGFSALFATYAVSKTYKDHRIINLFVVQNQHYSFNLDSYYMLNSTSRVNSSLEIPNFIRAPFILRMMERLLAKETYSELRSLYYRLSHCLSFADFIAKFTATINQDARVQLMRMEDWASQRRCPLIKVARNYSDPKNQTQVWVQYFNDKIEVSYIPLTFTTETSPNFNNFTTYFLPVSRYYVFSFKEDRWVIFNLQQVGKYRQINLL
ncbi:endoplasmic reticulum aminopeptidase 2-like [Nylanderia fulva]|uniref:endoplasmic reticulum aminopeptidase 2-like n=1 Tax=Nylanderia fulva TaxID=613905 RepID=UPI0010FB45B4|nr:endoplasmic reticulum aminopeptidase 2-like [Nylanderia fulva]